MPGLFSRRAFTGFGPDGLHPHLVPSLTVVRASRPAGLRARVRFDCPRRPGVYGMVDEHGELLYVGKSKCLRARLLSYFRPRSRDPKAAQLIAETVCLVWEPAGSEFAALLRELELIRRWQPRFNIQGQPHRRRRTFVCVGRRPAPYVFLSARPAANVLGCYGPVPAGATVRLAARRLNDWYKLRDCPQAQEMVFSDQQELFPVIRAAGCLRHEIGTCLGPCAAACSRADYAEAVRGVRAFLEGNDPEPLASLERDMLAASAALQFERAAALRDRLDALRWLHERLDRLRQARAHSFVYPVAGLWYIIHQGVVRAALVPEATTPEQLEAHFADRGGPRLSEQVEGLLLVASWFRRHPAERQRTLSLAQALDVCRTGPRLIMPTAEGANLSAESL